MTDFSGFTLNEASPVVLTGADKNVRDQTIFEIDSNTWGMAYMVGDEGDTPGLRLGIKYATAPKSTPHIWTKVDTFLIQTDTGAWDTNIDGGDVRKLADGSWLLIYGDYSSGKVGVATRAAGTFGAFTKHASNPVIDNTADNGAWNEYLRHPSWIKKDNTYYIFYEAREGAAEGTGVIKRRIGKATSTDLITWTLDDTPVFDSINYPGTYLYYNDFWMPNVEKIGEYYFMVCFMRHNNDDLSDGGGLLLARSSDLNTWTILNSDNILVPYRGACGEWDSLTRQEPNLFYDGTDVNIYYNSRASAGDYFQIGYVTLTRGAFDNSPASLFEDDFADGTINIAKWTTAPQGGITLVEASGKLKVVADGATQAIVQVLAGLTGFSSVDNEVWSVAFGYKRSTISGGDCMIGVFNAANTNYAAFAKGADLNTITLKLVVGGVSVLSTAVHYNRGRLKILREGCLISFWEANGTEWINLRGESNNYTSASGWTQEQIFPKVLAANSTTAYTVEIDDVIIFDINYPQEDAYVLSAVPQDFALVQSRMTALSAQQETAISTFITSCKAHGSGDNWSAWDEIFIFKLNSVDAPVGLKMKAAVPTGATLGANGYTLDGTDDSITTHVNLLRDALKYASSKDASQISFYLHTFGPTTSGTRTLYDASIDGANGSDRSLLLSNGTNRRFRTNTSDTSNRQVAGLFSSDQLINIIRSGSALGNDNMYVNGVLQTSTLGGASTGVPNAVLELGRNPILNTNFLNGVIGFLAIGKYTASFSQSSWNTDVRQLLTDLT